MDEEKNITAGTQEAETQEEEKVPNTEEAKNVIAEGQKKIDYSAALREKNRKIQELKREKEEAEKQLEEAKEEKEQAFDLGLADDDSSEVKQVEEKLKKLESRLEQSEKERLQEKQKRERAEAQANLDKIITELKNKYKDFNEERVLAEVVKRKGDFATPADVEIVYKAMKAEELMKENKLNNAMTEGNSNAKVVTKKKYNSIREALEEELGEPLE